MPLKALLFMSVFCGLLFVIQPALGIRCYRQTCRGTEECVGKADPLECPADADRCASMTFNGDSVNRNCARSGEDCGDTPCENLGEVMALYDLPFSDCSVTCCEGNGCNAPSKDQAK